MNSSQINLIVVGAAGRMGKRICELILEASDLALAAEIDRNDSFESSLTSADAIIDFSSPAATVEHAPIAATKKIPLIIGTTGLDKNQENILQTAAQDIPIVYAPNMSIGVNVLFSLLKNAAKALENDFKIELTETHHIYKKDKPSGTAKKALEVILNNSTHSLNEIKVEAHREGDVIGDHSISFNSNAETLTLSHHAKSRDIFAQGSLTAARWIVKKPAGFYGMADVLNL